MAPMTHIAALLIAVCAIGFGCSFVRVEKYALLSQDRFLRFCDREERIKEFDALDLSSSGEPINLRFLGVGLLAEI